MEVCMPVEFYDVKTRKRIQKEESEIKKTRYERVLNGGNIQVRYAFRVEHDERWLTKFCSKNDYDAMKVEVIDN